MLIHCSVCIQVEQKGNITKGEWKITKSWESRAPLLERALMHLLASLQQCGTLFLWIFCRPTLQSTIIISLLLKLPSSLCNNSTTSLASSSIKTLGKFNSTHKLMPSRNAHSFAVTLVVCPMALEYPHTHSPQWLRINPPPPALLGLPKEEPFEFNLNQCSEGGNHWT